MRPKKRRNGKISIIVQVAVMLALCIILTGILTYFTQIDNSVRLVTRMTEEKAEMTAKEVSMAVMEYPSYPWLLNYWVEHAGEMNIDYDEDYIRGSWTQKKVRLLMAHQPSLDLQYASTEEIEALPERDQKLYAEIIYSWLITRADQIKEVDDVDYLFCVCTQPPYKDQFFVFSGADPGAVRGTEYEQVYPIGVTAEVSKSQQTGMADAVKHASHIAEAGNYVDYYSYLETINGRDYIIGLTYNQKPILGRITDYSRSGIIVSMIYQVLLSAFIAAGVFFLVIRPLKTVQENIRRYKDTKDSASIVESLSDVDLRNEIGELAADVTDLAEEIDAYLAEISKITAEKERISAELSLATEIQVSTLPHSFPPFPDRDEFDVYAVMDPAREVGGDFYDFFLIDDDHLGLVMADVSGKGVPAALFMMISKILLKNCAMIGMSPAAMLSTTNNVLCDNNKAEMFVTVWAGVLEISTGKLIAANAGHEYPAIKTPDGNYELLNDEHGFVVAAMEEMKYKEYELQLDPGSALFLYTDGVPEAMNPDKELFGTDRMIDALNTEPEAEAEQVLRNVRVHVDSFVRDAEQFDDMTMMSIIYKGKGHNAFD